MLEGEGLAVDDTIDGREPDGGEAVTDQLLAEDTLTCWTCGSEVEHQRIEGTVEQLRSLRSEKLSERSEITDERDELKSERDQLQRTKQERQQAERRLEQVDAELERTRTYRGASRPNETTWKPRSNHSKGSPKSSTRRTSA